MSINFVINSQLYKDSIIGAYTLFLDSIKEQIKRGHSGHHYNWPLQQHKDTKEPHLPCSLESPR